MNAPDDPFRKDAEGAGKFALDLMRRYRKLVAKGYGSHDEWEAVIGAIARWAAHWAHRSKAGVS